MAFSFIKLISSSDTLRPYAQLSAKRIGEMRSDTLTKREAAILKICPPAIIISAEVIIAEYDAILGQ